MLAKGKKNHCVTGAEAIGEFWGGSMVSTPDICFKMGDTSVKARSDGTGVVQFQFQLGGSTLIPDDVIQKSMSSMQSISDKPFDSATTTMTTTTTYISSNMGSSSINEDDIELEILGEIANIDSNDLLKQQIDNASFTEMLLEMEIEKENQTLCQLRSNFEAFQIGGPMRAIPFQVRGVASMHLDSDNKIYFLQFDMLD